VYWLLTENYVLNANILVFVLIHTKLFSNVSGLGLGVEKIFGPHPRPHSFWPRPWPHAQLAPLTSLHISKTKFILFKSHCHTQTYTHSWPNALPTVISNYNKNIVYVYKLPGMDFGNALSGIAIRKDNEPLIRKPIHHAPTHCGSSGVRSILRPTIHRK